MASFASSATTCGAHKHAWTKKVGENNGQLRFIRQKEGHLNWSPENDIKSIGSAENVHDLQPLTPGNMSSFVSIVGHFYRSHWLFLKDISSRANGFLDVILRAPV